MFDTPNPSTATRVSAIRFVHLSDVTTSPTMKNRNQKAPHNANTREYQFLSRLKSPHGNHTWRHIFETYWKPINDVALTSGVPDVDTQEAAQEAVIAVSDNIGNVE